MFLVFWFLRFLCKFVFLRARGGNKEWFFHRFFCIHPHYVTMTKIESRDFALIFSGKRPFNTLSKINLSDIVIVTMNFHQYLAWQMLNSKNLCHMRSCPSDGWSDGPSVTRFFKHWKWAVLYMLYMKIIGAVQHWYCWMWLVCWVCLMC